MPNEERKEQPKRSRTNSKKQISPSAYSADKARWDSVHKWYGSKVTLWLTPQRADALWHYAKEKRLPLLPIEVLYDLIEQIDTNHAGHIPSVQTVGGAHTALPGQDTDKHLRESIERLDESTNDALSAMSTILLDILAQLRGMQTESPAPSIKQAAESSGIPIRVWLDGLKDLVAGSKPKLVVASITLPKVVTLTESFTACQVSTLQINEQRITGKTVSVLLPSLTVHTAVKKEPTGSTLLIARLKANSWTIEIPAVSADGKQKSTLSTFEI